MPTRFGLSSLTQVLGDTDRPSLPCFWAWGMAVVITRKRKHAVTPPPFPPHRFLVVHDLVTALVLVLVAVRGSFPCR